MSLAANTTGTVDPKSVREWAGGLWELAERLGPRFVRAEPRRRAVEYLRGLLSSARRKNGWQLAEKAGDETPYGVQHLLRARRWDADAVRDDLRAYVVEHLGDPAASWSSTRPASSRRGPSRPGCSGSTRGTAGRIENCQIGVFLAYAAPRGARLLDRELYLPKEWADDAAARQEAGVPDDGGVRHQAAAGPADAASGRGRPGCRRPG